MKEAVNFLTQVFYGSVENVATIKVAEAENDKETILKYLTNVKEYAEGLIEKVKNNDTGQDLHRKP